MKLIKYLKPYWLFALLTPLTMMGEVLVDLWQPKLMSIIVDDGVLSYDLPLILRTGILMLVLILIGALFGIASSAFCGCASQSFARDLRNDVFRKVMGLSFRQINRFTTGSLVTRLTSDITAIQQFVDFALRMFVRNMMFLVGGIAMMLTLNVRYGMILLISLPVEVLMVWMIMRKANPLYTQVAGKLDAVNVVMQENVTGARVVKAYVREEYEAERFHTANAGLMESNLRVQKLMAGLHPMLMIVMNISVLAVIWIGGWQVEARTMEVGEVMAAVTYVTQILHGIMMLSMMSQTIARASASAKRLTEVLDTECELRDGDQLPSEAKAKGAISFRNVSFSYQGAEGKPVLCDIDLEIAPGENIAILGATGSGKSTLVHLIPRFYDPTQGEILIDGVRTCDYPLHALREKIGIVLQKSELFSGSAADNIRWGDPDAEMGAIIRAAEIAQADEFIRDLPYGYDGLIAEKGASLSGGQKQRLSISRAVLKSPEILIFDDATSALDLGTEARLREQLHAHLQGTTVITIAQRIASVQHCDRIAVLDHGRLVACDTHEKLMAECKVYQDIYASQMKSAGGED